MNVHVTPINNRQNTTEQSREEVYDFMSNYQSGVLCCVDSNNDPHATVIYFGLDEEFNITFTTKRGTKKHDCLLRNDSVMLLVFDPLTQTTTQVIGRAKEIRSTILVNRAFRKTMLASVKSAKGAIPPIAKVNAGEFVAYNLIPSQICMKRFTGSKTSQNHQFQTVLLDF